MLFNSPGSVCVKYTWTCNTNTLLSGPNHLRPRLHIRAMLVRSKNNVKFQGHWDRTERALEETKVHFLLAWKSGLWSEPIETDPWIMKFQLKLVINQLQTTVFYLCTNEQDTIWFWKLHSLIRRIFWIDTTHTHTHTHTYIYIYIYIYTYMYLYNLSLSRHDWWKTKRVTIFQVTFESSPLPLYVYFIIWIVVYFCFGSPVDVTLTRRLDKTLSLSLFSLIGSRF